MLRLPLQPAFRIGLRFDHRRKQHLPNELVHINDDLARQTLRRFKLASLDEDAHSPSLSIL